MKKTDLFDSLDAFTNNLVKSLSEIEAMKAVIRETMEENAVLRMENEKLRDRLGEVEKKSPVKSEKTREVLNKVYLDGFHVCKDFYGQHRSEGCVWCDELLFRR